LDGTDFAADGAFATLAGDDWAGFVADAAFAAGFAAAGFAAAAFFTAAGFAASGFAAAGAFAGLAGAAVFLAAGALAAAGLAALFDGAAATFPAGFFMSDGLVRAASPLTGASDFAALPVDFPAGLLPAAFAIASSLLIAAHMGGGLFLSFVSDTAPTRALPSQTYLG